MIRPIRRSGGLLCRPVVPLAAVLGSVAVLGVVVVATGRLVPSGSWDVRGLVGPHLPPGDDVELSVALEQLFGDPDVRTSVHAWLRAFVLADSLLFVPGYGLALYCWLERSRLRLPWRPGGRLLPLTLALLPALADEVENVLTWRLLGQSVALADAGGNPGATGQLPATAPLLAATATKWLLLLVAVLAAEGAHVATRRLASRPRA